MVLKYDVENTKENEKENVANSELKILFFDISSYSPTSQFLFCSIGVFVFYLLYGYMQVRAIIYNSVNN